MESIKDKLKFSFPFKRKAEESIESISGSGSPVGSVPETHDSDQTVKSGSGSKAKILAAVIVCTVLFSGGFLAVDFYFKSKKSANKRSQSMALLDTGSQQMLGQNMPLDDSLGKIGDANNQLPTNVNTGQNQQPTQMPTNANTGQNQQPAQMPTQPIQAQPHQPLQHEQVQEQKTNPVQTGKKEDAVKSILKDTEKSNKSQDDSSKVVTAHVQAQTPNFPKDPFADLYIEDHKKRIEKKEKEERSKSTAKTPPIPVPLPPIPVPSSKSSNDVIEQPLPPLPPVEVVLCNSTGSSCSVFIDGAEYREGDKIAGRVITKITHEAVEFRKDQPKPALTPTPDPTVSPLPHNAESVKAKPSVIRKKKNTTKEKQKVDIDIK